MKAGCIEADTIIVSRLNLNWKDTRALIAPVSLLPLRTSRKLRAAPSPGETFVHVTVESYRDLGCCRINLGVTVMGRSRQNSRRALRVNCCLNGGPSRALACLLRLCIG